MNPGADPLQAFAAGLRQLREAAGRPTYQALARRAHRSSSSLSEAAGGRRLPTLDTTLAYVRALGGDEREWAGRWHALRATVDARAVGDVTPGPLPVERGPGADRPAGTAVGTVAGSAGTVGPAVVSGHLADSGHLRGGPVGSALRTARRTGSSVGLAAAVLAGVVIVPWLVGAFRPPPPTVSVDPAAEASHPPATRDSAMIRDGVDPKDAGCAADPAVTTLDSNAVLLDDRVVGTVELRYAPGCGASWPRFVPAPAPAVRVPSPALVGLTVVDGDDPARTAEFSMDYAGISAYGNLLSSTRTCVFAQVELSGSGWRSAVGRTGCWRGATQVRPVP
ncbi:helix-turn-helix domain-containing protein [Micromonospora sp. LOL_024]|uniref:helix-turn-helix domain-containing protein n=1 Tax=Micromonospora sp. LOL_024 TaxID=3345412 RepID=UPI003A859E63